MKRFNLVIIVLCVLHLLCYGQNFSLEGNYPFQEESLLSMMKIENSDLIIKYENPPVEKDDLILKYKVVHIDGMPFLELSEKMPKEVVEWNEFSKSEHIATDNHILFLAGKIDTNVIMFSFTKGFPFTHSPLTKNRYDEWIAVYKDVSSFLVEKKTSYPVDNLCKLVVDTPWVEGVKGDGIGEGFTLVHSNNLEVRRPYLLIMNGYISYDKPYLYKQNNRVKKITVTSVKSGITKNYDLLDSPHPQTIDISCFSEDEDLRIVIADIYKGTKYDDTCLHYCMRFTNPVIPYEDTIPD